LHDHALGLHEIKLILRPLDNSVMKSMYLGELVFSQHYHCNV